MQHFFGIASMVFFSVEEEMPGVLPGLLSLLLKGSNPVAIDGKERCCVTPKKRDCLVSAFAAAFR
jgi:hypothetical protein